MTGRRTFSKSGSPGAARRCESVPSQSISDMALRFSSKTDFERAADGARVRGGRRRRGGVGRENKLRLLELFNPSNPWGELDGGDGRIRTCDRLLTYNGLANRRLQPLGHISAKAKTYSNLATSIVKRSNSVRIWEQYSATISLSKHISFECYNAEAVSTYLCESVATPL